MASNDDVDFSRIQSLLQNIKTQTTTDVYAAHDYTVPSNKKWSLVAAYINQGTSDLVQISLVDINSPPYTLELWRASTDRDGFLPENKLTIPAGWIVRFNFAYTTHRFMTSNLLIEEEQLY